MMGLPGGERSLTIFTRTWRTDGPTDGQTDGRTPDDSKDRAYTHSVERRAVKKNQQKSCNTDLRAVAGFRQLAKHVATESTVKTWWHIYSKGFEWRKKSQSDTHDGSRRSVLYRPIDISPKCHPPGGLFLNVGTSEDLYLHPKANRHYFI